MQTFQEGVTEEILTRQRLFRTLFPDQIPADSTFFMKNWRNFSVFEIAQYRSYWLAMKKLDLRNGITKKLCAYFSVEDTNLLLSKLPGDCFEDENFTLSKDFLLGCARRTFRNLNDVEIEKEGDLLYKAMYPMENLARPVADTYTPLFSPTGKSLIVENTGSVFYPDRYIFKRGCYDELYTPVLAAAQRAPVAVIGDPGVGKSTFLKYIFAKKMGEASSQRSRIYWEMENGSWRYFDGVNTFFGDAATDVWKSDDVLVLIDGSSCSKHLSKKRNIILFCSPQPSNYAKLMKTFSGAFFVIPCWTLEEIKNFLFTPGENTLCELLGDFYEDKRNSVSEEDLIENPTEPVDVDDNLIAGLTSIDSFGSIGDYDELLEIQKKTKRHFLIEQILYRFKLAGGRIRLLLDNNSSISALKKKVTNAVNSMNLDELKRQECLDLLDNVPSILYSLIPDINTGYREYDILFASNYISERAAIKMHWEYGMKLNYLFAALQDQRVGSSLFGQLFESIVLEAITTKKINKFEGKSLETSSNESEQQAFSLTFGDFEIGTYDDNNPDAILSNVCNSTKNMLLTPIHLNAAAVDAIYFNAATKTIHFLQMTISSYHGFKLTHLQNLARALNITDNTQIKMVFVVPENCYHNFKKQPALKSKGGVYLKSYTGFMQYVLYVPSRLFRNVVAVESNEMVVD